MKTYHSFFHSHTCVKKLPKKSSSMPAQVIKIYEYLNRYIWRKKSGLPFWFFLCILKYFFCRLSIFHLKAVEKTINKLYILNNTENVFCLYSVYISWSSSLMIFFLFKICFQVQVQRLINEDHPNKIFVDFIFIFACKN